MIFGEYDKTGCSDKKDIIHLLNMFPKVKLSILMNSSEENDDTYAYRVNKNYVHFGAGLPSIEHEIAHMVEMNNFNRLLLQDWGMKMVGRQYPNFRLGFSSAAREIRVRAIQTYLKTKSRLKDNNSWMSSLINLLPFRRFTSEKDIIDWENDLYHRTLKLWNMDRIVYEWTRRVKFIRNWMETQ